ncbi:MAG: hypothetical protein QXG65_05530 [Thermoplasmata archaeon]
MALRETAWRVFAAEISAALHQEKGSGERAATYLLSPYGARMNRVLVVGALSLPETIGRDPEQPFVRSRLSDPTGTVSVTAGVYQPRALAQLRSADGPRTAVVVGKVHLYRGADDTPYLSVRAEALRAVDDPTARAFLAETLGQTLDRLDLLERVRRDPGRPDERWVSEGVPIAWVRAARASIERYPTIDRAAFRASLATVLAVARGERPLSAPSLPSAAPAPRAEPSAPPKAEPPPAPALTAADRAEESAFLDAMDELAEASADGYADLRELQAVLREHGLSAERVEALLDRLQEQGSVEEPIVGKLRRP